MQKLDNFLNCLNILKNADFEFATKDNIYRIDGICQFKLTFKLACEALQANLRLHGVDDASTGSTREILQPDYKFGFINDSAVWLMMLKVIENNVYLLYYVRN